MPHETETIRVLGAVRGQTRHCYGGGYDGEQLALWHHGLAHLAVALTLSSFSIFSNPVTSSGLGIVGEGRKPGFAGLGCMAMPRYYDLFEERVPATLAGLVTVAGVLDE